METQLREFIKSWYDKKSGCPEQSDVNFFIAHVWKRDLKESKLDYEKMVVKEMLNKMVNKGLTNVKDIIRIWEELRAGVEIKANDITERNPRKKTSVENNVTYREYDMTDTHRNKIYSKGGTIYLKLASGETRKLGVIDPKEKMFIIKRERWKHLILANNSYGYNHHFFSIPSAAFNRVLVEDEHGRYIFPVSELINENSPYLHFLRKGFERQVCLTIPRMETFRQPDAQLAETTKDEIIK